MGVGLGLLAKGPIVIILTAPPLFVWVLLFGQFKNLLTRIPWLIGLPILALTAIPWYVLAEKNSEGFIDYFIVGEHFKRFFDSSWKGDKYGFPKTQPLGIVWLFLLGMALPWVQMIFVKLWKDRKNVVKNKWLVFLLGWLLWTPMFFTISKSLIHTYVLPVMPPIALIVFYYWDELKNKKAGVIISLVLPCLAALTLMLGLVNNNFEKYSNTDKYLIEDYWDSSEPLYYLGTKSYSSQFYSNGKVKSLSIEELKEKMKQQDPFQIIISDRTLRKQKELDIAPLSVEGTSMKNKIYSYH
ncbi:ArnT family glycosyltransferase [Saccharicrinis fermentans]|uniref:ArnT family glycosyltransferase n=1 Tax=Saccharicrinis fermentans TaxID=982 RepID=UPI002ADDD3AA|nr:hypothetical protein [Saccharicrinis fermentans]